MDILIRSLIWLCFLYVINLGLKNARLQQQQKAEEKQEKQILSTPERREAQGEVGMIRGFFDQFPALWDAFEKQLKGHIVDALAARSLEGTDSGKTKLSSVYWNIGCAYWCYSTGAGAHWKRRLDEVFFEHRYYNTIKQLDQFPNLDALVAQRMEGMNTVDGQEQYRLAVKPLLDEQKQKLMAAFVEMAKELDAPQPYTFKIPLDNRETALSLGFQKRYKKRDAWKGMDGYTYSFNGRSYTDVRAFQTEAIEMLSDNVSIARDTFGDMVLRRRTEIPTFDSGDREWDSTELEYLMFDGKEIHLIVLRGGYHIAHLIFFEKLLTADVRMKPIFEKLGWPEDNIMWI
ncbi:MAG: hypothetical protein IKJ84_02510 [Oscillospiraceae bacterium]|nr:hypothetical protein [Oscillospiraceae bacterium]